MFFILSKLFWLLAAPSHVLGVLVLAGSLCALLRWRRATLGFAVAAALLLIVAGILPTGEWLLFKLESRYSRHAWPAHVDGILILGAGFDTATLRARGAPATNAGEMRVIGGYEAARRYPNARVVFSGGSGALAGSTYSEAQTARYIFQQVGLDPRRLTLEARSRNTYENILYSKQMVKPRPAEVWLLATSAIQLPRAMEIAHRLDWPMVPWPTDYLTTVGSFSPSFEIANNLVATDYGVHEWIGLFAYRLTGKSSAL
jgi:uncharacterized SAM-binding protein YcdF (DUF218 family)